MFGHAFPLRENARHARGSLVKRAHVCRNRPYTSGRKCFSLPGSLIRKFRNELQHVRSRVRDLGEVKSSAVLHLVCLPDPRRRKALSRIAAPRNLGSQIYLRALHYSRKSLSLSVHPRRIWPRPLSVFSGSSPGPSFPSAATLASHAAVVHGRIRGGTDMEQRMEAASISPASCLYRLRGGEVHNGR